MNNSITVYEVEQQQRHLAEWQNQNPMLVVRGIDEPMWNALCTSVFPGANPDSVLLAVDYCRARSLDIMLKPVHIVPMWVKDSSGKGAMRDVVMPGIGLYRIQAARAKDMAGMDAPLFGPMVTYHLGGQEVTVPEWCTVTVHKLVGDRVVSYPATEYWIENYATKNKDTDAPNAMWKRRSRAQLVKCAEAQALRKGWPEVGQEATAEEMEGRTYANQPARDITPETPKLEQQSTTGNAELDSILSGGQPEPDRNTQIQQYVEEKAGHWMTAVSDGNEQGAQAIYEEARAKLINQPQWMQSFEALIAEAQGV